MTRRQMRAARTLLFGDFGKKGGRLPVALLVQELDPNAVHSDLSD